MERPSVRDCPQPSLPEPAGGAPSASPSELIWQVCQHMRGLRQAACRRCPSSEDTGHGMGTRGCYLLAEEIVNLVQTGHPQRQPPPVSAPA